VKAFTGKNSTKISVSQVSYVAYELLKRTPNPPPKVFRL